MKVKENDYTPFGDEWRKEMMKFRKSNLVDWLKERMIKIINLEQKLSQTITDIPTFIIPHEKEVYDDVEIHPVCEEKGVCSVCDEGDAHFWSVYLHVPKKGIRCIADLKTREHATQFADLIEFLLNLQDE